MRVTDTYQERRTSDLLDSARELAQAQGVRTLTLTAIATRAGVHVSGVRRYFESRKTPASRTPGSSSPPRMTQILHALITGPIEQRLRRQP